MTVSGTDVAGVQSVNQRESAMAAEFYPTHTILPHAWYFLGHGVGHIKIASKIAASVRRANESLFAELKESFITLLVISLPASKLPV